MSRPVINDLANLAWDGACAMETISIPDPSRLRVPFPGRGQRQGAHFSPPSLALPEDLRNEEMTLDISTVQVTSKPCTRVEIKVKESTLRFEKWSISLAYCIFALLVAVCTLSGQSLSGRDCCLSLSPLPVVCLALQAATATSILTGLVLLLCALLLPCICCIWELSFVAAYMIVLALALLAYTRQKGVFAYVSTAGAVLALGQTAVYNDPFWGVSVSFFFLTLLCVSSCEGVYLKIWI